MTMSFRKTLMTWLRLSEKTPGPVALTYTAAVASSQKVHQIGCSILREFEPLGRPPLSARAELGAIVRFR